MRKRYVFWKTPAGKPHRSNDGKHAPYHLLAELGKTSFINNDGGVSWPGTNIWRWHAAIQSTFVVRNDNEEINDTDSWRIMQKGIIAAITKLGGSKPIRPNDVLEEADRIAAEHIRIEKTPYILVTSLSVASLPWKTLRINGCTIRALKNRGRRYPMPSHAAHLGEEFTQYLNSSLHSSIRINTLGRTPAEAIETATTALDVVRGVWNLRLTYGSWTIRGGITRDEPLGEIHAGPVYSLHYPDGHLVDDTFIYDQGFIRGPKILAANSCLKSEAGRRWLMTRMRLVPYRRELEKLMVRYAIALDHADYDVTFLKLWSLLERVTNTVGDRYDKTIKRTVWGWAGRKLAIDVLESVRLHRNEYVHAATSRENRDQITFLMKSFLDPHLLRLVRNDFKVRTIEEYGNFLQLPSNVMAVEEKMDMYRLAARTLRASTDVVKQKGTV